MYVLRDMTLCLEN